MSIAFIFPGQGSQFVGMGKELFDNFQIAKLLFQEVDEILKYNLSSIIFNGPDSLLKNTVNLQPALMTISLAIFRILESEGLNIKKISYTAGHSLGEYSALTAFKAFDINSAMKILKVRSQSMTQAVLNKKCKMVVFIGLNLENINYIIHEAAQGEICEIANDNSVNQIVLSGQNTAIDRAILIAKKKFKLKKIIPLNVSAPFHCSLLYPAIHKMNKIFDSINFHKPLVPLVSNQLAYPITDPNLIKLNLLNQITNTVKWRESIIWMINNNVNYFVELGAGSILTNIIKRNFQYFSKKINSISVNSIKSIDNFVKLFLY